MKPVFVIVATTPKGEIGFQNGLPWKLEGDLPRFKRLTMGNTVIMGRKTYESLPGPLKGRTVIVVTSKPENLKEKEGILYSAKDLASAIEMAQYLEGQRIYIAGGAKIYEEALQHKAVDGVHLTTVYQEPKEGYDTVIQNFSLKGFHLADDIQYVNGYDNEKGLWILSHTYSKYVRL